LVWPHQDYNNMSDRKAELEKKRKKLEELKRARELSKQQAKDKEVLVYNTQLLFNTRASSAIIFCSRLSRYVALRN